MTKISQEAGVSRSNSGGKSVFGFGRAVALVFVVMALIAGIGAWLGLQGITLVNPWVVWGGAAAIGAASALTMWKLWRGLTGTGRFGVNYVCHFLFCAVFLAGSFYALNAVFVSADPPAKIEATVISKYTETRHQSKRVGRNRYVQGPAYKVYCVSVQLNEGRSKSFEIPFETYRNLSSGALITLSVRRGLFGVGIIVISDIRTDNPQLRKAKKSIPFHKGIDRNLNLNLIL